MELLSHAWQLLNIRGQDGQVLAEYSPPSGGWRFIFIYAGNQRIAMRRANGNLHYYLNDHLSSAKVVIDSAGTVKDKQWYYAFGSERSSTVNTGQKYLYTGKPFDDDDGIDLYYYGARYYDADLGRFLSVDPLASKYPGWSPYVYTLGNPMKYIDPTGMAANEPDEPEQEVHQYDQNAKGTRGDAVMPVVVSGAKTYREAVQKVVATRDKVVTTMEKAAADVGAAVVKTADALEEPTAIGGALLIVGGLATAQPEIAAAGGYMTLTSLGCNLIQTGANPTPANLKNSAIQTGLSVVSLGGASGLKGLATIGRLTTAQSAGLRSSVAIGTAAGNLGASHVYGQPGVAPSQRIPGMILPSN